MRSLILKPLAVTGTGGMAGGGGGTDEVEAWVPGLCGGGGTGSLRRWPKLCSAAQAVMTIGTEVVFI